MTVAQVQQTFGRAELEQQHGDSLSAVPARHPNINGDKPHRSSSLKLEVGSPTDSAGFEDEKGDDKAPCQHSGKRQIDGPPSY